MSGLDQAVADYLAVRRALGYKLARQEKLLAQFTAYLDHGAITVTAGHALAWAVLPGGDPAWHAYRLEAVNTWPSRSSTWPHRPSISAVCLADPVGARQFPGATPDGPQYREISRPQIAQRPGTGARSLRSRVRPRSRPGSGSGSEPWPGQSSPLCPRAGSRGR